MPAKDERKMVFCYFANRERPLKLASQADTMRACSFLDGSSEQQQRQQRAAAAAV